MKNLLFFFLILPLFVLHPQGNQKSNELTESIKNDVWIPFMEAYAELDSEKLKSIHTSDIFRVTIDQNRVQTGQPYLDEFGGFLEQMKQNDGGLGIAFAILSTAFNETGDLAYQTGYYEFSSKSKDEEGLVARGYGFFNVALRKTDGTWKLFLDSDKRIELTKEEFEGQDIVYRLQR